MIDVNLLRAGDTMIMRPAGTILANGPGEAEVTIVELDVDEAGDIGDFAVVAGKHGDYEVNPRDYLWRLAAGVVDEAEETVCGVCTRDLRLNPHAHA